MPPPVSETEMLAAVEGVGVPVRLICGNVRKNWVLLPPEVRSMFGSA